MAFEILDELNRPTNTYAINIGRRRVEFCRSVAEHVDDQREPTATPLQLRPRATQEAREVGCIQFCGVDLGKGLPRLPAAVGKLQDLRDTLSTGTPRHLQHQ